MEKRRKTDQDIINEFKSINVEDEEKIKDFLDTHPFVANYAIDFIRYYGNKNSGIFASYITNYITDNEVLREVFAIALVNTFTDVLINILRSGIYPDHIKLNGEHIRPLDYAVETKNIELIKILIHYGYFTPRLNNEIFNIAVKKDDLHLLRLLLEHNYEVSSEDVKLAIKESAKKIVNYLFSSGIHIGIKNIAIPDDMIPIIKKYYIL